MIIFDSLILALLTIVPLMVTVAFFTLAERKIMGLVQKRQGPMVVGFWGILQPLADGVKLFLKEIFIPQRANNFFFFLAPLITLFLGFNGWAAIPFNLGVAYADINLGLLYLVALSSLGVYGILIAGWASNSKYAFLGSIRSLAQMISYEISLSLTVLPVILCAGSLNLMDIVIKQSTHAYAYFLLPASIVFFISMLAETNRAPFDLPESEAEIVAGYNLEYSSITFAIFFLGEYSNMILMSALCVILFFGGFWSLGIISEAHPFWFSIKIVPLCFLFIFVRANYPRMRYDHLMDLGWKIFLPQTFGLCIFLSGLLVSFNGLPYNFVHI